MKILLIGGEFVNKGAEAMILSTQSLLEKHFINPEIVVATYEKKNIGSTKYPRLTIVGNQWIKGKIKMYLFLRAGKKPKGNLVNRYKEADIIINIAGFSLTDQHKIQTHIVYALELLISKLLKKPFIVFPQAMGPFKSRLRAFLVKRYLPIARLIMVRDTVSCAHLTALGIKSHIVPDIAFNFELPEPIHWWDNLQDYVCIIPNTRIYERDPSYIDTLVNIINNIDNNILLLPHEFHPAKTDDLDIIKLILPQIRRNKEKIYNILEESSASQLKSYISEADTVITSRYHGAIASLSSGVPTLTIGWAHKYDELMKSVGFQEFALDYRDKNITKKTQKFLRMVPYIRKSLGISIPEIKKKALLPAKLMKDELTKNLGKYKKVYVGYAKDPEVRAAGQSGGLISAILIASKQQSIVADWNNGTVKYIKVSTKEEILKSAKSKYCPVEPIKLSSDQIVVGTPCQLHGIGNPKLGLFCDRALSYTFIQDLYKKLKINPQEVKEFVFRDKRWKGWPGDIRIELKNGKIYNIPTKHRQKLKSLYTLPKCWNCKDKYNKNADLSFGDAFFDPDKLGKTVVIVRTDQGEKLLKQADVVLKEVDPCVLNKEIKKPKNIIKAKIWRWYFSDMRSMGGEVEI